MTDPTDDEAPKKNYRKPPEAYQFKKGVSGNPRGRPRKKAVAIPATAIGGPIYDELHSILLFEAKRMITVQEGGKKFEMPAIQAALRSMFRRAAGNDSKTQNTLLQYVAAAEQERRMAAIEILKEAQAYKDKFGPIFDKHKREGLPPPDQHPNPDNIHVEPTGEVKILGPSTREEAGALEIAKLHAAKLFMELPELEKAAQGDPGNVDIKNRLKEARKAQDFLEKQGEDYLRRLGLEHSRKALEEGGLDAFVPTKPRRTRKAKP